VLDSADYGNAVITQSVSIVAPDGVYARVTAPNDQTAAINISGENVTVALRGLSVRALTRNLPVRRTPAARCLARATIFSSATAPMSWDL